MVRKTEDLTGRIFSRLKVIDFFGFKERPDGSRKSAWNCECECGNKVVVESANLKCGHSKSCGCLKVDQNYRHGWNDTPEYDVFRGMQQRCYNPKTNKFEKYGGRGIGICDRWLEPDGVGILNFIEDMGPRPSLNHTIERVNVDGDYCPENCIWTDDLSLQAFNQNKRTNNTSGRTGVQFFKRTGRWVAGIDCRGERIHLGYFDTFEEACAAREAAELKYFGFTKE